MAPTPPTDPTRDVAAWVRGLVIVALGISIGARFATSSPLWLDEALSANIASLPLNGIASALRADGHPPLYYFLLHIWTMAFGSGDLAVRSLSGVLSLVAVVPAWFVGRRVGGRRLALAIVVVLLLNPFVFHYGSETRMYALVMALVWVGMLALLRLYESPNAARAAAVALVASALLWSHYWSMWLVAGTGLGLAATCAGRRIRIRLRPEDRAELASRCRATIWALGALVLGGLSFLPWLPTLLYQAQHTGTPWAPSFRPATLVVMTTLWFSGGQSSEAQVGAYWFATLMVLGVVTLRISPGGEERERGVLTWRFASDAAPFSVTLATTIAIAAAFGLISGTGFAPRYAAVIVPLMVMLVALGITRFAPGRSTDVVLAITVVTSIIGVGLVFTDGRSQVGEAADAIRRAPADALVVVCPDQMGPPLTRALGRTDVVTYPATDDPRFVDWVDYRDRLAAQTPEDAAAAILRRATGRPIVVVANDTYLLLETACPRLQAAITAARPQPQRLLEREKDRFFEAMWVDLYPEAP
ncbi:MAG: glycosyltransferase family 39 protein [Microthrixaceae bacterium]|nr:glycosyltransferase family 39 protein [Microthrixaceae bacterium]HMT23660.1 glycosyltransferase family 39 protein [Microthrixaceae bacterium]HMT60965.1 glycosyltransferase family 39 protein [Microthrixaceae bacterium]